MVQLEINSVNVDFPYEPYPAQIQYMSHVIEALRTGNNALLESPTGTGKTLCLLCAALAWRATYVAALQAHTLHSTSPNPDTASLFANAGLQPQRGAAFALSAVIQPAANQQLACPRIIFSSRTHSQLSQAVSELKKTVYNPFLTILASRDLLCIHDISSSFSGSRLNAMCRNITAPNRRQCRFHLPIASNRPHENRSVELMDKLQAQPPMDIEDLREFGVRESACPWFMSRTAARSDACEILFLPYNYLLDRSTRQSLDINWANDIIIIDEAHNLESICSDLFSFDLSATTRSACDVELSKLIEKGLQPGGLAIPALEKLAQSEKGMDSVIGSENRDLLQIRLMRSVMASLEDFIRNAPLDPGKHGDLLFKAFSGNHIRNLLKDVGGLTLETYELFLEMMDRTMGVQTDKKPPGGAMGNKAAGGRTTESTTSNENTPLVLLQNAIRILFESVSVGDEDCFKTVIQQSSASESSNRVLSYWCFKPSIAMKSFQAINMRCILLTSGTLAPLNSFANELGISFPIRLENPHVITKPQVWAGVIRSGPELDGQRGGRLTSAYYARGDETSLELGRALIRFVSVVPDGVLVFYPSYAALYSCVDTWKRFGPGRDRQKPSVLEHLQRYKRVVVEDRENSKALATVLAHRANVDSGHGSILLAVCRGRVSEGIDFSDEHGRAVIITGLPYPSAVDPKIILKRQYADEQAKKQSETNGRTNVTGRGKVMNGSEWYNTLAMRAVNQAIGRAIRHRFDYGAILLCEERFQSKALQENISKWLRDNIVDHRTFGTAESSLRKFFTDAVMSEFAEIGDKRRVEMKKRLEVAKAARSVQKNEDMRSVFQAQSAIERMQPRPTTESQFVDQMVSLSEAIQAEKQVRVLAQSETPDQVVSVLDLSSAGAQGGLRDSGSISRIERSEHGDMNAAPLITRSEMFLTKRAEREEIRGTQTLVNNGSVLKRIKTGKEIERFRLNNSRTSGKRQEKFSDRIKGFFGKDSRRFSECFQQVLSAHEELRNEPNETRREFSRDRENARGRGEAAIRKLVAFTRAKSENSSESGEQLLIDLGTKIPSSLKNCYDNEIRSNR